MTLTTEKMFAFTRCYIRVFADENEIVRPDETGPILKTGTIVFGPAFS